MLFPGWEFQTVLRERPINLSRGRVERNQLRPGVPVFHGYLRSAADKFERAVPKEQSSRAVPFFVCARQGSLSCSSRAPGWAVEQPVPTAEKMPAEPAAGGMIVDPSVNGASSPGLFSSVLPASSLASHRTSGSKWAGQRRRILNFPDLRRNCLCMRHSTLPWIISLLLAAGPALSFGQEAIRDSIAGERAAEMRRNAASREAFNLNLGPAKLDISAGLC
jgi:hypothetical protein